MNTQPAEFRANIPTARVLHLQFVDIPVTSMLHCHSAWLNMHATVTPLIEVCDDDDDDQSWYWTEEWQAGERQADHDIATGDVTEYASPEDFLASL